MSEPHKKILKTSALLAAAGPSVSIAAVERIVSKIADLRDDDPDDEHISAKDLYNVPKQFSKIHTPHGHLMESISLKLDSGSDYHLLVCNPIAILHHLCETCSDYARF
eukprot:6199919-Pyramimonas_sp.AAC.1